MFETQYIDKALRAIMPEVLHFAVSIFAIEIQTAKGGSGAFGRVCLGVPNVLYVHFPRRYGMC